MATWSLAAASVDAQAKTCPALASLDSDHDGKLDLTEAKAAASARFTRLDSDKDNTLDAKELKRCLSVRKIRANDPDHDGTLDRTEYIAIVRRALMPPTQTRTGPSIARK
ncbi:MAG: EF-hand domain-containing protein [Rhodomicrobium sp.]